jgi:hypothetical protein
MLSRCFDTELHPQPLKADIITMLQEIRANTVMMNEKVESLKNNRRCKEPN